MNIKPRSVMFYGASGASKTTQSYHLAKYILSKPENKGKKFRIIHSDTNPFDPFSESGMLEAGRVERLNLSGVKSPLAYYRWLSDGYWPRNGKMKDGTVIPMGYFQKNDNCKVTPEEWNGIAGYIIDGYHSTAEVLKAHITRQPEGQSGLKGNFKPIEQYEEEGETLNGAQESHYGMIQKEMYERHSKGFANLPMEWLICTSLIEHGKDKRKNQIYGPSTVGNAQTHDVPSWFSDCFHLDQATWEETDGRKQGIVAWFQKHMGEELDADGTYLAKTSILSELYPKLLEKWSMGFCPLGFKNGIAIYFNYLEKILRSKVDAS